ncbi:hypothetical protein Godav_000439, partial [Gossypium davidsonii]|nr:hypothetical protein [Gossypium davidsonii]
MSKEVAEQVEPMETHGRARKVSQLRDMLSALEGRVVTHEESMKDLREKLKEVEGGLTNGLELMNEKLRDYVLESLNYVENKMTRRDDTLDTMVTNLKEEIAELKGELIIYKATLGNGVFAAVPNLVWMLPSPKNLRGQGIMDNATKVNTIVMYFTDVALLWCHRRSIDVRRGGTKIGTWEEFQNEFKEVYAGASELMLQIFYMGEKEAHDHSRISKKDKLESSKLKFKPRGNDGGDKDKPTKNGNRDNGVDKATKNISSILGGVEDKSSRGLMFVDITIVGKRLNAL